MTALTDNMTFGTFMAPFHRVGENPTLALERDLETRVEAGGDVNVSSMENHVYTLKCGRYLWWRLHPDTWVMSVRYYAYFHGSFSPQSIGIRGPYSCVEPSFSSEGGSS